jgi:hypothetical protein
VAFLNLSHFALPRKRSLALTVTRQALLQRKVS